MLSTLPYSSLGPEGLYYHLHCRRIEFEQVLHGKHIESVPQFSHTSYTVILFILTFYKN